MVVVAIISLLAALSCMLLGAPPELIGTLWAIGYVLAFLQLVVIVANRLTAPDQGRTHYVSGHRRWEDKPGK